MIQVGVSETWDKYDEAACKNTGCSIGLFRNNSCDQTCNSDVCAFDGVDCVYAQIEGL